MYFVYTPFFFRKFLDALQVTHQTLLALFKKLISQGKQKTCHVDTKQVMVWIFYLKHFQEFFSEDYIFQTA